MGLMDEFRGWLGEALRNSANDGFLKTGQQEPILAQLLTGTPQEKEQAEKTILSMIADKLASHQIESLLVMRETFAGKPKLQALFTPANITNLGKLIQGQDETRDQESIELFRRLCKAVATNTSHVEALDRQIIDELRYLALSGRGQDLVELEDSFGKSNKKYRIDNFTSGIKIYPIPESDHSKTPGVLLFKKNPTGNTEVCLQFQGQPPITDTELFLRRDDLDVAIWNRIFPALRGVRDNNDAPKNVRKAAYDTFGVLSSVVVDGVFDFNDFQTMPIAHPHKPEA